MSQTHGASRRSCLHQKPCRSSRGRRRQRTQHSEITRDAPITTRGTRISTLRDQLDPQGKGCNGARRTTKPGTEGKPKPRSAVKQEIIRVVKEYLKVVDDLELTLESIISSYNLQRLQSKKEDLTEEEEMKEQQRMAIMKDLWTSPHNHEADDVEGRSADTEEGRRRREVVGSL